MKYLLLLSFTCVSYCIQAQQKHFIYIQTDNRQPFYVRLDKKVFSSSVSGYLIIPKLQEDTYPLYIGFPKNEWPGQTVTARMGNKDQGFVLKNFGEKGWGLFNLQTLELTMGDKNPGDVVRTKEIVNDDFANTLSNVVNDSSIREKEEVKEAVKPPVKEIKNADPVKGQKEITRVLNNSTADGIESVYTIYSGGKEDTVRIFIPVTLAVAIEGIGRRSGNGPDSVKAPLNITDTTLIYPTLPKATVNADTALNKAADIISPEKKADDSGPVEKPVEKNVVENAVKTNVSDSVKQIITVSDTVVINKEVPAIKVNSDSALNKLPDAVTPEKKTGNIDPVEKTIEDNAVKKTETDSIKTTGKGYDTTIINTGLPKITARPDTSSGKAVDIIAPEIKTGNSNPIEKPQEKVKGDNVNPVTTVNSDCKNFASDEDFLKLRKKMASESNDDDMITVARKYFKAKCFKTVQVKNLGYLFLKDEGKYKFFDAVYPFVSDTQHFPALQDQLTETYYINRFKAMIQH